MRKATTKRPVRIAFVSDAIYPYNKGGKETRLYNITTRLAKLGVDVHVYTMQWWDGETEKEEDGVHLHAICPKLPLYAGDRRSITQGIAFGLACFRLLFAPFDVVDVDHMPFFPLYSMRIVCWLKGKKMYATWHEVWGATYWHEYLPGIKGTIAAAIERGSFLLPDMIVSVSEMTTKRLQEQGYKGKIITLPNGIDTEAISQAVPAQMKSDIIFAGRLLKHKNVDVLIQAVDLIRKTKPDVRCLITGEGPELEDLKLLVKKLDLEKNITFLPFQNPIEKLYGLMKSSKVFVLPSTREGFGLAVLEANACGIPVITVDHPDNAAKDLIKNDENGIVCDLSAGSMAAAIQKIIVAKKSIPMNAQPMESWESVTRKISSAFIKI
jgi:glycosyltransferase involved in cell wall biosynthesis